MFDPEHLDNCSLLEANEVLTPLGIMLACTQISPISIIYNVVSADAGRQIGMRWSLESQFGIYSFGSPGDFMRQLLDEKGILEFLVWPDGRMFVNEWRGKPYEFAIASVLSGCA